VSIGVLTKVFPPEIIDEVIATGPFGGVLRNGDGIAFRGLPIGRAGADLRRVELGGAFEDLRTPGQQGGNLPCPCRFDFEPVAMLFEQVAEALTEEGTSGCFLSGPASGGARGDLPGPGRLGGQ